jgi:DNA replication and repair protein RecF
MHLEKLNALNYKNYEELDISLNPRINVFIGKNGSGKTNVLDAIYYLSLTKSAFSLIDAHCIRHAENHFMLKGIFWKDEKSFEVSSTVQTGAKKIFRENQLDYEKLSDHIGKYPLVLIAPDDTDLIKEGSELRRKFFDGIIAQIDKGYLEDLISYNQVLKQRNSLLKMFYDTGKSDFLALEAYDHLLIKYGTYIFQRRQNFLMEFHPIFQRYFYQIVDKTEMMTITHLSSLSESDFSEGLVQSRQKDLFTQRTNFGIHKDDFEFLLEKGELKRIGSQGQQKSFVIALKLAQCDIIEKYKGHKPLLLLDDIFDKLDDTRINKLLELIKGGLGQLFITDARPHRTMELLNNIDLPSSIFLVEKGTLRSGDHLKN